MILYMNDAFVCITAQSPCQLVEKNIAIVLIPRMWHARVVPLWQEVDNSTTQFLFYCRTGLQLIETHYVTMIMRADEVKQLSHNNACLPEGWTAQNTALQNTAFWS